METQLRLNPDLRYNINMMMLSSDYRAVRLLLLLAARVAALSLTGCHNIDPKSGYTSRTPYNTDINTVSVEMFKSQSFRRGGEYEITRAIAQQIELHSPYKVVSDSRTADTRLYGEIRDISERVLSTQRDLDRPIENEIVLSVDVTWKDLRSGELIMDKRHFRVSAPYAVMLGAGENSGIKIAANEMARRIVEAMQQTW